MIELHDHQSELVEQVRGAYREGYRAPLVCLSTGGGKTVIFSYIANKATGCVLIIAHRSELIKQISLSLGRFDTLHNVIAPENVIRQCKVDHFKEFGRSFVDHRSKVFVASVQTLVRRFNTIRAVPDLIIIDEAHHLTGGTQWAKVADQYPKARRLLVTATPIRLDGKGLDEYADKMILGKPMRWLIDNGYLSDYRLVVPPNELDLSGIRTKMGDYEKDKLESAVDKPSITGDAVKHYLSMAKGKRAIVFCVSIKHGKHVAEQFNAAGIPSEMLETDNRESAIQRFRTGEIQVLTSCEIVSEGFDLPAIEVAILLRPTKSMALYLQQVGRALRVMGGKDCAIILDHVGNSGRVSSGSFIPKHGMPDDDREWSLKGRERKRRRDDDEPDAKIRTCPACYCVHKSELTECPQCGHVYVAGLKREIKQVEGNLVEIKRAATIQRKKEERDCKTLEDFIELGRQRGYQYPEQWAKHRIKFRQKKS